MLEKAAVVVSALNCALFKQEESLPLKKATFLSFRKISGQSLENEVFSKQNIGMFPRREWASELLKMIILEEL